MSSTHLLPADERSRLEDRLDEFDAAWSEAASPCLEDFYPPTDVSPEARHWFLRELVMMDLGQRWRRQRDRLLLEAYRDRFPELGPQLTLELIAEEYRVRRLWGESPAHDEYFQRFPGRRDELQARLPAVDAELAAELNSGREQRIVAADRPLVPFAAEATDKEALGPYLPLELLGEGGLGQVFKARHRQTGKLVALKTIRAELLADREIVQRFYREVKLLERLDHPHLVQALDAGESGGRHFLAMEFVDGIDLGKLVKAEGPLSVELACAAITQAARGLAYAHEQGLVHRDIKPSNLMLAVSTESSAPPTIKILDLGLARLNRPDAEKGQPPSDLTSTLTPLGGVLVMGTPDYLAPEQAVNFHGADVRADIYSLGCTFYYLLTRQPPFPGGTLAEKLWRHQQETPAPIGNFRRDVDPELTAILFKMLAKKPEERYQSPTEVVAALEAVRRRGRLSRWLQRSRWLRPYAAAALLIGLMTWAIVLALSQDWNAAAPTPPSLPAPFQAGLGHERFPWQPAELVAVLGEERQRHWGEVNGVAIADKRNWIVSAGNDHVLRVWDATTMREWQVLGGPGTNGHGAGVLSLTLSHDGKLLASGARDHSIRLWDFSGPAPRLVGGIPSAHIGRIYGVAFARHGRWLASCADDRAVRLWDLTGAEPRARMAIEVPEERFYGLAVSSDDRLLAAGGYQRKLRIWDVAGDQAVPIATLDGHKGWIRAVAFTPDDRHVVTAGDEGVVRVWSLDPEPREVNVLFHGESVQCLRFAADGKLLATGCKDGTIHLWTWPGAQAVEKAAFAAHQAGVTGLAFTADGNTLISSGSDGTIRKWNLAQVAEVEPLKASACLLREAQFSSNGQVVAGITVDGEVRCWRLGAKAHEARVAPQPEAADRKLNAMGLALTNDRLAYALTDRSIRLWDLAQDQPLPLERWQAHDRDLRALAFTRDQRLLASGGVDQKLKLWNIAGKPTMIGMPMQFAGEVARAAFAADGSQLASASGGKITCWKVAETGLQPNGELAGVGPLVWSPTGHTLAGVRTVRDKSHIHLWDLADGQPVDGLVLDGNFRGPPRGIAFSPDDSMLAACHELGVVQVWDLGTGRSVKRWELPGAVNHVGFTPDRQFLLTANINNTIYLLRLP
jgi:WD40 repeat protein/serine/threonine protein kinase